MKREFTRLYKRRQCQKRVIHLPDIVSVYTKMCIRDRKVIISARLLKYTSLQTFLTSYETGRQKYHQNKMFSFQNV